MKKFGTDYGGFYYPKELDDLDKHSIIYCIGAGEDISHDIAIANKLNSKVYIIDPTLRAIKHYELVKNVLNGKDKIIYDNRIGGGKPFNYWKLILENKININNLIYKECGVGIKDGIQKFYLQSNEEYVSYSLVEDIKSKDYIEVEVKKLRTIMNEYGHKKIDLLKIDTKGLECDVISNILDECLYPKYLSINFDLDFTGAKIRDIDRCNKTIEKLIKNNYELLHYDYCNFTLRYNNIKMIEWNKTYYGQSPGDLLNKKNGFAGRFSGYNKNITGPNISEKSYYPKILIVGDSILGDYCCSYIRYLFNNVANINFLQQPHHCKNINSWLDEWEIERWDYDSVFFFDGMHGFPERVTTEEHEKLTPLIVKRLQTNVKNILWGNCTPIPADLPQGNKNNKTAPNTKEQRVTNEEVIIRNSNIEKIMNILNIPVIDLYNLTNKNIEDIQLPQDIHFSIEGEKLIAKEIVNKLCKYFGYKLN